MILFKTIILYKDKTQILKDKSVRSIDIGSRKDSRNIQS
jgi:hypothetical protein